ncbi:MAG: uncharacterized membrane protein (UPF0127 family) [Paracoccaceae bacterium]|jgi:uncharacterized membrane protein (UPF0127 family)
MRFVVVTILLCFAGFQAIAACSPDKVALRGSWGQVEFAVAVVDTDETRSQGLMFVQSLPRFAGMLFVYETPRRARFWMKNTLIPLDMIFISPEGVVKTVHSNAIPGDLTSIDGGPGVQVVLEVNGGTAQSLGINVGSEVLHAAFGAQAVWSCE